MPSIPWNTKYHILIYGPKGAEDPLKEIQMAKDITDTSHAINNVLEGLQWLIIHHSKAAASEQYRPQESADASDDWIKEHKEWVSKLRTIRTDFETLVTGLL
ncbi:MAG TPA: hypothetical protein VF077_09790 [Nitrospiraceae bacterium]